MEKQDESLRSAPPATGHGEKKSCPEGVSQVVLPPEQGQHGGMGDSAGTGPSLVLRGEEQNGVSAFCASSLAQPVQLMLRLALQEPRLVMKGSLLGTAGACSRVQGCLCSSHHCLCWF